MRSSRDPRHLQIRPAGTVLVLVLAACNTQLPTPGPDTASFTPQSKPPPAASSEPTPPIVKDLTERPQIWFSPLDPSPPDDSRPFNGGPDFMALFHEDAPWEMAAAEIHVFKLYGGWVARGATDGDLSELVSDLNRRGIAIGFEASPLRYGSDCAAWLGEGRQITRRLEKAGATVRFVAFDHPYDTGVLAPAPAGCGLSPEQAAQGVVDYAEAIRERFPEVVIGTIETAANERSEVERWVEAYRSAAGKDFDFFHLDLNFARPDWPEATLEIETFLRGRGIEMGMIYFGNWEDRSDAVWLGRVEDRFVAYELLGGRPDHAIFQSWHPSPQRLLPETDASAFTSIVGRYLRPRTSLTLDVGGGAMATGILASSDGTPLADARVEIEAVVVDGRGVFHEYTVSGTVPAAATLADMGYRVNTECACSGASEFTLYSIGYAEGGVRRATPDADLWRGLGGWVAWGAAPYELGNDGLHVLATAAQDAAANSPRFVVTPGAAYTATFVARVAPASLGSGYFSIIFSDGQSELTRQLLPLTAAALPLGSTSTDAEGRYQVPITLDGLPEVIVRASYAGDADHWPARVEAAP